MSFGQRSVLCLFNWNLSGPIVDDGSYINWLEGTRLLDMAMDILPIAVSRVETVVPENDDPGIGRSFGISPENAIETLQQTGATRVLIAGNFIEREVIPFSLALVRLGIRPVVLFDVCGTLDPMTKWRSLATAVDDGVEVSTVQQTLRMLLNETTDRELRARITAVMHQGMGEHAGELTAA